MTELSQPALESVLAQECPGLWVWALEISADEWGPEDYLYLVNTGDTITIDAQAYTPMDFKITGPEEGPHGMPEISVEIDAIDQTIPLALLALGLEPLSMNLAVAYVAPDTSEGEIQWGPMPFTLYAAQGDNVTVRCTASLEHLHDVSCPAKRFTRAKFPGLFAPSTPFAGDRSLVMAPSPVAGGLKDVVGQDLEEEEG